MILNRKKYNGWPCDFMNLVFFYTSLLSGPFCSACETEWEISPNTGTTGGTFVAAQTVEECRDLCIADPDCLAIDASSTSPVLCFLHTNQSLNGGDNFTNSFISQHILVNRCENGKDIHSIMIMWMMWVYVSARQSCSCNLQISLMQLYLAEWHGVRCYIVVFSGILT